VGHGDGAGLARANSPDVRFGHPALRSASPSWLRSISYAARLARASPPPHEVPGSPNKESASVSPSPGRLCRRYTGRNGRRFAGGTTPESPQAVATDSSPSPTRLQSTNRADSDNDKFLSGKGVPEKRRDTREAPARPRRRHPHRHLPNNPFEADAALDRADPANPACCLGQCPGPAGRHRPTSQGKRPGRGDTFVRRPQGEFNPPTTASQPRYHPASTRR